jgi:hypothetical protein
MCFRQTGGSWKSNRSGMSARWGTSAFQHLKRPRQIDGQRARALRYGDARAQAIRNAVLPCVFVARGFTNQDLRQQFAILFGRRAEDISPGRKSYALRRLRLHGLIERLPHSHRYRLAAQGLRTALFYTLHPRIRAHPAPGHGPDGARYDHRYSAGTASLPSRRSRCRCLVR